MSTQIVSEQWVYWSVFCLNYLSWNLINYDFFFKKSTAKFYIFFCEIGWAVGHNCRHSWLRMRIIRGRGTKIICGCRLSVDVNLADADNTRMQISNIHTPLLDSVLSQCSECVTSSEWHLQAYFLIQTVDKKSQTKCVARTINFSCVESMYN